MFPSGQNDGYAYLPDELLEDILEGATEITTDIQQIFDSLQTKRASFREKLVSDGKILRAASLESVSSPSVCAVDGGLAIEKSIGADTVLVVAVGVEGLVREDRRKWTGVQHRHWRRVLAHEGDDNSRFAKGVMAALELEIATQAPHDVIIFDGSHLTPIIGLNSMLSLDVPLLGPLAGQVLSEHKTTRALDAFFKRPSIISMVKYDSSRELSYAWFDEPVGFDDRTLMTLLLEEGEYTQPIGFAQSPERKKQLRDLHIRIAYDDFEDKDTISQEFAAALSHARSIQVVYYRPHKFAPTYRIELKSDAAYSSIRLATILQAIREQVVSPEVREPYPQYLADEMAKSVGAGLQALRTSVMFNLTDNRADELMRMLTQSYRTD